MLKRPLSSPDVFNVKNRMKIAVKVILIAPLLIFCKLFYLTLKITTFLSEKIKSYSLLSFKYVENPLFLGIKI